MDEFEELFEVGWRQAAAIVARKFLEVFQDIRDTQNQRLEVEKDILAELRKGLKKPAVKAVVTLGTPVSQI